MSDEQEDKKTEEERPSQPAPRPPQRKDLNSEDYGPNPED